MSLWWVVNQPTPITPMTTTKETSRADKLIPKMGFWKLTVILFLVYKNRARVFFRPPNRSACMHNRGTGQISGGPDPPIEVHACIIEARDRLVAGQTPNRSACMHNRGTGQISGGPDPPIEVHACIIEARDRLVAGQTPQ